MPWIQGEDLAYSCLNRESRELLRQRSNPTAAASGDLHRTMDVGIAVMESV